MNVMVAVILGIAIYLLIVLLFSSFGTRKDTLRRRIDAIGKKKPQQVIENDINKPFSERFLKPMVKSLAKKIGGNKNATDDANMKKTQKVNRQKKLLSQAGLPITVAEYGIIRLFVIGGLALLIGLITIAISRSLANALLGAFVGLFFGYTGMRYYLTKTINKRKRLMEQQLPDVLDLLSVSVEAGLGFEQAITQITVSMEGPLIDEFTVTSREMSMGRTRKDALTLLGERCDIEELKSFAGALSQASQLGISIKNVLRAQAAAMRQARRAKVQEKAMKVSVKILFPMLIFIFPSIFIILLGPAVVNVLEIFAGK